MILFSPPRSTAWARCTTSIPTGRRAGGTAEPPAPMADDGRLALAKLMADMQHALQGLFAQLSGPAKRHRRGLVQRRLLLGLELLSKIEEQLVLPVLVDPKADPQAGRTGAVAEALREIELMRDVALLATQTARANRSISLAVLDGIAFLHFTHMNALIARADMPAVGWHRVETEARSWLLRWYDEVRIDGEIEDEDADPVGAPAS